MKVFVSIDLEGVSGVFAEAQTTAGTPQYAQARRFMREDLDAVIQGCLAAGADEIVVADGHDRQDNLNFDGLPDCVTLASGSPSPLSMMQGMGAGFDCALLIGYHAMAGTAAAILDHTYTYDVFRVRVDEHREIGELALNAAVAGCFGVPVAFASGDDKLAAEAAALLPGVRMAVVKQGTARTAGLLKPPQEARAALRAGAQAALSERSWPAPLDFNGLPLRLTFTRTGACDAACWCPGVRRVDARTIDISVGDYLQVFSAFLTCVELAYRTRE